MRKNQWKPSHFLGAAALAVSISACTHAPIYEGTTFIKPPEDISTAWLAEDGGVYLVPEKGVVVDRVLDREGNSVKWSLVGSYLAIGKDVLDSADGALWLLIEGKKRKLDYKALPTRR